MKKEMLISALQQDPTLVSADKMMLISKLSDAQFYNELMHGATGGGLALAISKYFKLSQPAQILLSMAGFGIGRYLLEETKKHDKFLQYNEKLKTYKINA